MSKVGIFFGTDTGTTRKIAKMMYKELGEAVADKPVNINRADADSLAGYDYLILGTPTYGSGELPGMSADCQEESWEEFLPNFDDMDLDGKKVALYGLGDQVNYAGEFVDGLGELYEAVSDAGAEVIGSWSTDGYTFDSSAAEEDGQFCGLVLDNDNQSDLHAARITEWIAKIKDEMGLGA